MIIRVENLLMSINVYPSTIPILLYLYPNINLRSVSPNVRSVSPNGHSVSPNGHSVSRNIDFTHIVNLVATTQSACVLMSVWVWQGCHTLLQIPILLFSPKTMFSCSSVFPPKTTMFSLHPCLYVAKKKRLRATLPAVKP